MDQLKNTPKEIIKLVNDLEKHNTELTYYEKTIGEDNSAERKKSIEELKEAIIKKDEKKRFVVVDIPDGLHKPEIYKITDYRSE